MGLEGEAEKAKSSPFFFPLFIPLNRYHHSLNKSQLPPEKNINFIFQACSAGQAASEAKEKEQCVPYICLLKHPPVS